MDNRSKQRPYATIQFVAFFDKELPPAEKFEPVLCKGLGAGTISFFWNGPTPKLHLIVTVGTPLGQAFMHAEVVYQSRVMLDGKEMYRVECRFVRRIDDHYSWDAASKTVGSSRGVQTNVFLP
jgi:hypothetical protein